MREKRQRKSCINLLKAKVVVLEAIDKVNRELGAATAVITHNADIAGMADRVVHMSNGHVSQVELNARRRNPRELHW